MDIRRLLTTCFVVLGLWFDPISADESQEMTLKLALVQRAHQYWDAIKVNDQVTAYRIESGSIDGTLTPHAFRRDFSGSGRLVDYQFNQVRITGDQAVIDIRVAYELPQLRNPVTWDKAIAWTLVDGQWYHKSPPPTPHE
jgi:hypothetical protein